MEGREERSDIMLLADFTLNWKLTFDSCLDKTYLYIARNHISFPEVKKVSKNALGNRSTAYSNEFEELWERHRQPSS